MFWRSALLAVVCLSALALAQTTQPAAQANTAAIVGKDIHIRCGPSLAYYACIKLSAPAVVQIVGQQGDWIKIAPPEGSFSLIAKKYVKADGGSGAVGANNVNVRAGSDVMPNRTDHVQTQLGVGDKVSILGEAGEYYKIAPPQGVVYYVKSEFLNLPGRSSPEVAASSPSRSRVSFTEIPDSGATSRPMLSAEQAGKLRTDFEAAEAALQAEYKKPREQRNIEGLLKQYQAIIAPAGSGLEQAVKARLQFLADDLDLKKDQEAIEDLLRQVKIAQANTATQIAGIQKNVPPVMVSRGVYTVEGILQPSGLYPGGATGPKRYTIGTPGRPLVSAYVQSTGGLVDLEKYVGCYVGINGKPKYDEKAGMYVVEAEKVDVKEGPEPAKSAPPAPKAGTESEKPAESPKPESPASRPVAKTATAPADKPATAPAKLEPTSRPTAPINPNEYD